MKPILAPGGRQPLVLPRIAQLARGLALALGTSLAVAAGSANAVVLSTTFNTGTLLGGPASISLPNGAIDPNYVRVSNIGAGTAPGTLLGSARVQGAGPLSWVVPGGNAAWIEPAFNSNGTPPSLFGTHYYQTTFDLSGYDPSSVLMAGAWATDDANGVIYLNGQILSTLAGASVSPSMPSAWSNFSYVPGNALVLNPGLNFLTFEVNKVPGPIAFPSTGLLVDYRIDALPVPEPSTYALFAFGLAAVAAHRKRLTLASCRR